MASWTKTVSSMAAGITVPAAGTFFSPITTTQIAANGATISTSLAVATGSQVQIAGSIQNSTTAPGVGAIVALMSSPDAGTTWYMIARASAGVTVGTAALGTLSAAGNYPFSFSNIPDGNQLLALVVYNNTTNSVALFAEGFVAATFA